jgi:hypothetical protein
MDELTAANLSQKYRGTTCKIAVCGIEYIIYVEEVGNILLMGVTYDGVGDLKAFPMKNVEFLPIPKAKLFDVDKSTMFFSRRPERQWRVGLCEENTRFENPVMRLLKAYGRFYSRPMVTFDSPFRKGIENLFLEGEDKTIQQAISKIEIEGRYSTTINDSWFVSVGLEPNTHLLFYLTTPVGVVGGNKIRVIQEPFYQEVEDLVRRTGGMYVVV